MITFVKILSSLARMECLNQFLDYFWTENVRPLQNKTEQLIVLEVN